MPIKDCYIKKLNGSETSIFLPIKLKNSHTGLTLKTWGLLDTGATDCAVPAKIAAMLGHNLTEGEEKKISTGNGTAKAYRHAMTISIFHPESPDKADEKAIHIIENVLIDCMPDLPVVLLGVSNFLSEFELVINYPKKKFSLIRH